MAIRAALRGRPALVTGVTRREGIGAAIARELARAGAPVFTAYFRPYHSGNSGIDPEEPLAVLDELRGCGVAADGLEIDLASPEAARTLIEAATASLGAPAVLVNNAAYSVDTSIDELEASLLDAHYAVNLRATALLCREFLRSLGTESGGRIINITSGQGLQPMPWTVAYAATKGGVDALTVSLSESLAARGVTVNAVDPGPTDTGWMTPELKGRLDQAAPAGRVSTPDDAARLVRFLASDEAEWITGQIIRSRGGFPALSS